MDQDDLDFNDSRKTSIVLPDMRYIFAFLRRQMFFGIIVAVPIAVLGVLFASKVKDIYATQIRVVYDDRDRAAPRTGRFGYPRYQQIVENFSFQLADERFNEKIARRLGMFDETSEPGLITKLKRAVYEILGKEMPPPEEVSEVERKKIIAALIKARSGVVYSHLYTFALSVQWPNAKFAAQLAEETMDQFIEDTFNWDIRRLDYAISSAEIALETAEKQKALTADRIKESLKVNLRPEEQLSEAQIQQLVQRERRLVRQYEDRSAEYSRLYGERLSQKLDVEGALQRLQAQRRASHPDVVRMRNQLRRLEATNKIPEMKKGIDELRAEIIKVREQLSRVGVFLDEDGQVIEAAEPRNRPYEDLLAKMNYYKIEKANLENQLLNPEARSRFRVSVPPKIADKPMNAKKKLTLLIGSIVAALAAGFFVMLVREIVAPLPKDKWKILNSLRLPFMGELTSKSLKKLPELDGAQLSKLKKSLAHQKKSTPQTQALMQYRMLAQELIKTLQGKRVLVVPTPQTKHSEKVLLNIVSIMAADRGKKCLVIDLNHKTPLFAGKPHYDVFDVMSGEVADIRELIEMQNERWAFDRIGVSAETFGKPVLADQLQRALGSLEPSYDYIFLHGYEGEFFVENSILAETASDGLVLVNAKRASYKNLHKIRDDIHPQTIMRGAVLAET